MYFLVNEAREYLVDEADLVRDKITQHWMTKSEMDAANTYSDKDVNFHKFFTKRAAEEFACNIPSKEMVDHHIKIQIINKWFD